MMITKENKNSLSEEFENINRISVCLNNELRDYVPKIKNTDNETPIVPETPGLMEPERLKPKIRINKDKTKVNIERLMCKICNDFLYDVICCTTCFSPYCKDCILERGCVSLDFDCKGNKIYEEIGHCPTKHSLKNAIVSCNNDCGLDISLLEYKDHLDKCASVICWNCNLHTSKARLKYEDEGKISEALKEIERLKKLCEEKDDLIGSYLADMIKIRKENTHFEHKRINSNNENLKVKWDKSKIKVNNVAEQNNKFKSSIEDKKFTNIDGEILRIHQMINSNRKGDLVDIVGLEKAITQRDRESPIIFESNNLPSSREIQNIEVQLQEVLKPMQRFYSNEIEEKQVTIEPVTFETN